MTIFLFGAGYSARVFAAARPDPKIRIVGTTRSPDRFPTLEAASIEPLLFDGHAISAEMVEALRDTTDLIISAAPDEAGDPVLNVLGSLDAVRLPALQFVAYLSTVGVYGDHVGAWVDESGECRPVSRRSLLRVDAEQAWQAACAERGVPLAILRLSGIYGPGRNAFVNLENGTARRLVKPGQVFNRIHVADIAGALWHLVERRQGGVFNVTDDLPAPPQDVVAHAAVVMGVPPPPEIPFDQAELTPMARSFYGENKRVSNAAIKATGYGFRYPDYRAAHDAMWAAGDWRGEASTDARSPMKRS